MFKDRAVASDDVKADGAEHCGHGDARLKILDQCDHGQHRADGNQAEGQPAQARDANGMNHVERHEGPRDERSNGNAGRGRRPVQQEQVERRHVPQSGKAPEMIVVRFHAPIGEI